MRGKLALAPIAFVLAGCGDMSAVSGLQVDTYDATAVVSVNQHRLRATAPAALGDDDSNTYVVEAAEEPDTSGILAVAATDMEDLPSEVGEIAHVVFSVSARAFVTFGTSGEGRIKWTVGGITAEAVIAFENLWPIGGGMDPEAWQYSATVRSTAAITTQPNGQPWTREAVAGLTMAAELYYADAFWPGPIIEFYVTEMSCEVYAQVGFPGDIVPVAAPLLSNLRRELSTGAALLPSGTTRTHKGVFSVRQKT